MDCQTDCERGDMKMLSRHLNLHLDIMQTLDHRPILCRGRLPVNHSVYEMIGTEPKRLGKLGAWASEQL